MSTDHLVDHLFRHEYGKMVSSLTRIYGLENLELIEDAVQDVFQKATLYFRNHSPPDNPQAWLRTAVKNRAVDLFRKLNSQKKLATVSGPGFLSMTEVFSEHEIQDSQLRLLFAICHPDLSAKEQIIFALKTLSGFSTQEIASVLLHERENVKKSLHRARKKVKDQNLKFKIPTGTELKNRLETTLLTIYLLFTEGFHSSGKAAILRKDLVAEALRLNGLIIEKIDSPNARALMALMCFHAARLPSKVSDEGQLIKLRNQDRSKWLKPLIMKGHIHMQEAVKTEIFSRFHWEAAIAAEYVRGDEFRDTNWGKLESHYINLESTHPSPFNLLNLAVIQNQQGEPQRAMVTLGNIDLKKLKGKEHLYYSARAEILLSLGNGQEALNALHEAHDAVKNAAERALIKDKITTVMNSKRQ